MVAVELEFTLRGPYAAPRTLVESLPQLSTVAVDKSVEGKCEVVGNPHGYCMSSRVHAFAAVGKARADIVSEHQEGSTRRLLTLRRCSLQEPIP